MTETSKREREERKGEDEEELAASIPFQPSNISTETCCLTLRISPSHQFFS
jgi:hypothetical protein